jgi:hypothetical protein
MDTDLVLEYFRKISIWHYSSYSAVYNNYETSQCKFQLFRTMRSWDRNVVLVKCTVDLRCWEFGMGGGRGGDEKGEVSSRATWYQGGQDRITPKEGFQVSRGNRKGKLTVNQQGEQKKGELRCNLCRQSVYVYI